MSTRVTARTWFWFTAAPFVRRRIGRCPRERTARCTYGGRRDSARRYGTPLWRPRRGKYLRRHPNSVTNSSRHSADHRPFGRTAFVLTARAKERRLSRRWASKRRDRDHFQERPARFARTRSSSSGCLGRLRSVLHHTPSATYCVSRTPRSPLDLLKCASLSPRRTSG